jgi:HNH endonuclease
MNCVNCGKETNNPKFCNKSCSAIWTNTHHKKKKLLDKFCTVCGEKIKRLTFKDHSHLCDKHRDSWRFNDNIPLKEIIYINHHKSSAFALVRSRARTIAKYLKMNKCTICGYDKHIEICHIKPISEFSKNSLVSEINSQDNLVALCPNHHWEFDSGLITL